MCGFSGEINFGAVPADIHNVQRMLAQMEQRGPDACGLFQQDHVALGHRRLSIIDLSVKSQQPMVDAELGLACVFNGAIYNYKELRRNLQDLGYRFFSEGDTEVLIKGYHAWGSKFVERLHGMFAFAIWERDSGKVVLARDRLGIKPLYYSRTAKRLLFASNVQALLQMNDIDTSINPVALHHYFSFHAVVPPPHTILRGISKIPPATIVTVFPDGQTSEKKYWDLEFPGSAEDEQRSESEWVELTEAALRRAITRRLEADVPVGVLLSGGLDSSLITAMIAGEHSKLKTFSIGFETVGEEQGDEFKYSDIIAKAFGTEHQKLQISSSELMDHLPQCIASMSEPMVSHDAIGFYLLSREVSKQVKVVQSGQGADEVFAGYHWYPKLAESKNIFDDYRSVFFDRNHEEYSQVVDSSFVDKDWSYEFAKREFARPGASNALDKALRMDTTVMLVDDPVKRVDNMTMAFGLEARVPFLDHELVELAARIPARHKLAEDGKGILKKVGRKYVSHEVIDRKKGYFPVPALKYIRGPYLELVKNVFSQKAAQERKLINRNYLDLLLSEPDKHITPLRGSKLWQVTLLELWLQMRGI